MLLCALVYFGVSWPIYGTMLINAMGWPTVELPFVTMPYFPQSIRSQDLIFFSPRPLRQLGENAKALWQVGFRQGPDLPWNAIDGFGTVYRCAWPLGLLGLGLCVARAHRAADRRQRLGYRLLLLYWLCALLTGLCVNGVNVNRLNILFYAHALFIVLGAEALLRRAWLRWPLLGACLLLSALFFHSYFGPWAERISDLFYEDFLQAVSYAGEQEAERIVITPDVQFTGSRQVAEILTLYELDVDAEYFQGKTDEPIPYRERFVYRNLTGEDLAAPTPVTLYVLKTFTLPPELRRAGSQEFGEYALYNLGG